MANGYASHLTLDRIDNDKGYEPANCRWGTWKVQGRNKRHLKQVGAFGEKKLTVEWSEDRRCVVSMGTLAARLRDGWPPELAITVPPDTRANYGSKQSFDALMGHADGSMLARVYSHIDQKADHLKKALVD